ncbi:hypothetical protein PAP_07780 [Palaeococcus pacificus DY20341]|uniref:AMP-dependent synthetase/ligase domain-containing protein n=1 Tax=Palaeococcus pacificus DY20341 TaxID=1343739 RepID=A0A075LT55_9EURY|nr:hypothetical protein [Palaeococcus pacificus]AIF69945.1 hypothetical protein PAP_07780 [Palaeococcus pacificus DY20341]
MIYEEARDIYKDPFDIAEKTTKDYLREIFEFHLRNTPYWHAMKESKEINLDEIFTGSFENVIENIFNSQLFINDNDLRTNWLSFLPNNYKGELRFYQSSGTTGQRSFAHWDYNYVHFLVSYLRKALDKIYALDKVYDEEHRMRALAHGPYGWYQDEMSRLVWSYQGLLYFIGMETDGLKKELKEKGLEAVLRKLDPLMRYTQRVLEKDKINTIRTAPPLLNLFESVREEVETLMISGVGITPESFEMIQSTFENAKVIPFYGHFAFGDVVGIYKNKELRYYPNYPFTIIFPLTSEGGTYRLARPGESGKTGLIIARPEILVVKVENEQIKRVSATYPFKWDGFANPSRAEG